MNIFYTFMLMINTLCASTFNSMKHPLTMGLTLLIQTLMICILTGQLTKTFWFSYILFLIFVGGMLVLFIYVSSLASNEIFKFSLNIMMKDYLIFLFLIFCFYILFNNVILMNYPMAYETSSIIDMKSFTLENTLIINKLYNFPTNLITIMMMIYLFLTLIAVVKITNIFEGPLRPSYT